MYSPAGLALAKHSARLAHEGSRERRSDRPLGEQFEEHVNDYKTATAPKGAEYEGQAVVVEKSILDVTQHR